MRTLTKAGLLSGAALAILVTANSQAVLAADCDARMMKLNETTSQEDTRWLVGSVGQDIRELRDAAQIFARNGQEEACEEVIAGIEDMIDQRREQASTGEEKSTADSWHQAEVERLKTAQSVDKVDGSIRAADIIGSDLRNMQNEDLGEIDDVVLSSKGDINYAIIAHGGLLGMGEKLIAVPWQRLKVTSAEGERVFVLDATPESLEAAPSFERDNWMNVETEEWKKDIETFFDNLKS